MKPISSSSKISIHLTPLLSVLMLSLNFSLNSHPQIISHGKYNFNLSSLAMIYLAKWTTPSLTHLPASLSMVSPHQTQPSLFGFIRINWFSMLSSTQTLSLTIMSFIVKDTTSQEVWTIRIDTYATPSYTWIKQVKSHLMVVVRVLKLLLNFFNLLKLMLMNLLSFERQ